MTDESTTARKMAIDCEMLKIAYRQTKDGIVVSFLIHPQHVPDGLAVAALGTRYIVALVELGDDETPRPPKRKEVTPEPRPDTKSKPTSHAAGGARSRSWHDMPAAAQAGMMSNEETFCRFMGEKNETGHVYTPAGCAAAIRLWCNVSSRSNILPGTPAAERWRELMSDYRAWMRAPEVV